MRQTIGSASSLDSPGGSGSLGFDDPTPDNADAFVPSQMETTLTGDLRDVALRKSLYAALLVAQTSCLPHA